MEAKVLNSGLPCSTPESKRPALSHTSETCNSYGYFQEEAYKDIDADLLTMNDFKDCPINQNWSSFEMLLKVGEVASLKLDKKVLGNRKENIPKKIKKSLSLEQRKSTNLKNKQQQLVQTGPDSPPDLPEEFKKKIREMDGLELTLLIQKSLYLTDVSIEQNRLSLPLKQIKNPHFLREKESQKLMENQALDIILIEPSLHTRKIMFGKWNYTKSSSYVLRSCWKDVVNANGLKVNDVVQVWSFRVRKQIRMALVKLSPSN